MTAARNPTLETLERLEHLPLGGLDGDHRPTSGSSPINRPRAATSVHASSSENTPATCAAASSPIEWPIKKSGRTPQLSTSLNNATSSANSAAWVKAV